MDGKRRWTCGSIRPIGPGRQPRNGSPGPRHATCNVQRATCNVQRATCNVQPETYDRTGESGPVASSQSIRACAIPRLSFRALTGTACQPRCSRHPPHAACCENRHGMTIPTPPAHRLALCALRWLQRSQHNGTMADLASLRWAMLQRDGGATGVRLAHSRRHPLVRTVHRLPPSLSCVRACIPRRVCARMRACRSWSAFAWRRTRACDCH